MKSVAIIGLGWLGMPLAQALLAKGWRVTGCKRSVLAENSPLPFKPTAFTLTADFAFCPELAEMLATQSMVIALPPSRIGLPDYLQGIKRLVSLAISQGVRHILFVSSTSVFPQQAGEFDENSEPIADNPTAEVLIVLERWLATQPVALDIVRPAGLVGNGRHPVRTLAGRTLTNGNQPINLVHLDDCISAIIQLLEAPNGKRTFHLVANSHPSRAIYYTQAAEKLGLAAPQFVAENLDENPPLDRLIHGRKICQMLGFRYRYDDPLAMI